MVIRHKPSQIVASTFNSISATSSPMGKSEEAIGYAEKDLVGETDDAVSENVKVYEDALLGQAFTTTGDFEGGRVPGGAEDNAEMGGSLQFYGQYGFEGQGLSRSMSASASLVPPSQPSVLASSLASSTSSASISLSPRGSGSSDANNSGSLLRKPPMLEHRSVAPISSVLSVGSSSNIRISSSGRIVPFIAASALSLSSPLPADTMLWHGPAAAAAVVAAAGDVVSEMTHDGGRVEKRFVDDSRLISFPNGTKKFISSRGLVRVDFPNGDCKHTFPDQRVVYYYASADTTHITDPSGLQVYHFGTMQTEKHFPNGSKEILYSDGTVKCIYANGDSQDIFADGRRVFQPVNGTAITTYEKTDALVSENRPQA